MVEFNIFEDQSAEEDVTIDGTGGEKKHRFPDSTIKSSKKKRKAAAMIEIPREIDWNWLTDHADTLSHEAVKKETDKWARSSSST